MNDTTFQGDGKVAYVPAVINTKPQKQTNADRIRAMTDEELAAKIEELCQYAFMQISVYAKPFGKAEWLEWLKQEASDDNDDH